MRCLSILLVLGFAHLSTAQDISPFDSFNSERMRLSRSATWVLGSWAGANLGAGALIMGQSAKGSEAHHFGSMTMGWSAINLAIVVPGLLSLRKDRQKSLGIPGTFRAQRSTETIYLLNTGLDLGYMGLGLWMQERGLRAADEDGTRLRGFGNAILVQGAFLFTYDLVAWVAHRRHWAQKRDGLYRQLQFNGTSLSYTF